jgi:hypothetical protein
MDVNAIRKTAWDVAEKTGASEEVQKKIAKDVANAIWTNLYPDKGPWKNIPRKP